MAALIDAAHAPDAPYDVALVLANKPQAGGLAIAAAKGVPILAIDHRPYDGDRTTHEQAIQAALETHDVQIVALAGYMRVLTPWLVERWAGRMLNIHPSLLPLYPGLHTHARALAAGDRQAGCTVHLVTEGVDEGEILGQAAVPVQPDDTPDSLAQRVLQAEHRLYPEVLTGFCRSQISFL